MDNETANSMVFLVFGLGFFLFVIWLITHTNNVDYTRTLNERREFGYKKSPIPVSNRKTHRKK